MNANADALLIEQLKRGESHAIEQLLADHEARVYRFGLRMCGNEDDARDVLQETLLAAFKNVGSFRADAQLSTWLFQIARSFCLKQRRRHQGEPANHESVESSPEVARLISPESSPESVVQAREIGQVIQSAMNALPAEQREVLILRDVEGLSAEAAATVVGVEVGALKSRLHRARLALKHKLSVAIHDPQSAPACPELIDSISAYAANEIDQSACEQIEAHLATCPRCSAACEELKRTVSLCRAIPGGAVPDTVKIEIRRAITQLTTPT